MREKRDVKNRCERSVRNRGSTRNSGHPAHVRTPQADRRRLRGRTRLGFFETFCQFRHDGATRDDRLGCFISLNASLGQSHDESRFAGFRLDLDLTTVPVSHDALADCQAETFSRTDTLCSEKRFEDVGENLGWNAGSVVRDFHDRLIVLAPRSNGKLATAVHRIRGIIEQVHPHLREFARIAAHAAAVYGKVLGHMNVLELMVKSRECAFDLLLNVDIRGFCALLPRAGTHGINQTRDAPGALFCVIEQCADRQPQRDPSDRIGEGTRREVGTQ